MKNDTVQDVTWLYEFARKWYVDNPGQQIPIYDWERKVGQAVEGSDPWAIYAGINSIKPASHNIIPGMAAIDLGLDAEMLGSIIKHHEIVTYHITQTVCQPIYDDDEALENEESIAWDINQSFINAIMLDQTLADSFVAEYTKYGVSYEMEMAWLLCDHAPFWPDTLVSLHLEDIAKGTPVKSKAPPLISAYALESSSVNLKGFSDKRILSMLKRSGNLRLGLTTENGFEVNNLNTFFRTLLSIAPKQCQNVDKVLEVINKVQDQEMISLINSKILETLSERNAKTESGVKLFSVMKELLNSERYGSISKDLVLNLKLFNKEEISAISETAMADFQGNHLMAKLDHSPGLVLEELLCDLKALKPENFRRPHFEAIGILLRHCGGLDESAKKTCKELLFIALNALDAYRLAPHYKAPNAKKDIHVEPASEGLGQLIRLVALSDDIDYSEFSQYSSGTKALLASNGFSIKKLPGINRSDRGQVLSDQLGL
jgi:hypothetical protein